MSGPAVAAVLLGAALLAAPPPPRRRLVPADGRRVGRRLRLVAVAVGGVCVAVLLPAAAVLAAAVLVGTLAARDRRRRRDRQRRREGQALAAALEVLVGELRVGAHPVRAFGIAAAESDGTVGTSLRAVAARARLGADVAAGLRAMADDSSVPAHWDRLGGGAGGWLLLVGVVLACGGLAWSDRITDRLLA